MYTCWRNDNSSWMTKQWVTVIMYQVSTTCRLQNRQLQSPWVGDIPHWCFKRLPGNKIVIVALHACMMCVHSHTAECSASYL